MKMKRYFLLAPLFLSGCSSAERPIVTKEEAAQVKVGMTYEQVVAIIGDSGKRSGGSTDSGGRSDGYKWVNPDGSYFIVLFYNGKIDDTDSFSSSNLP